MLARDSETVGPMRARKVIVASSIIFSVNNILVWSYMLVDATYIILLRTRTEIFWKLWRIFTRVYSNRARSMALIRAIESLLRNKVVSSLWDSLGCWLCEFVVHLFRLLFFFFVECTAFMRGLWAGEAVLCNWGTKDVLRVVCDVNQWPPPHVHSRFCAVVYSICDAEEGRMDEEEGRQWSVVSRFWSSSRTSSTWRSSAWLDCCGSRITVIM